MQGLAFKLALNSEKKTLEAIKDGEAISFALREGYKRLLFDADEIGRRKAANIWPQDYEWRGSSRFIF